MLKNNIEGLKIFCNIYAVCIDIFESSSLYVPQTADDKLLSGLVLIQTYITTTTTCNSTESGNNLNQFFLSTPRKNIYIALMVYVMYVLVMQRGGVLFSLMLIVFNLLFRTWGSPGLFVLLQLSILGISSVSSESSQFLIDITALVEVHWWLIGLKSLFCRKF